MTNAVVIRDIIVIDGRGGRSSSPEDVFIENGMITAIGTDIEVGSEAHHIDGEGQYLLPGFIDTHVHLRHTGRPINPADSIHEPESLKIYRATRNMQATIEAGVTYVRDLGGIDYGAVLAVEQEGLLGPRLVTAIQAIGPTGGHSDNLTLGGYNSNQYVPGKGINPIADGPAEAAKRTRELLRSGAGVIKVMGTGGVWSPRDAPEHDGFTEDELRAVVSEASNREKYVASHAQGASGIKNSLRAGVTSIEHGYSIDAEGIELMKANNAWLVPTLLTGLTPPTSKSVPDYARKKKEKLQETLQSNISAAVRSGVNVALGTDSGVVPHGQNLKELSHLVECGMTPMEAIIAGTFRAAELLQVDHLVGSVEVGKEADLVITDIDPEKTIELLNDRRHIKRVMQRGVSVVVGSDTE